MWTGVRRTGAIIFTAAAVCGGICAACAAPQSHPRTVARLNDTRRVPTHRAERVGPAVHGHAPTFRPARGAAAADARRLGALVGKECSGRADMQRDEGEWVVLCSNGRSYLVEPAVAHQPAMPPVECSLAGIGPEPACFP